jgi:teichuronic acid biosynthesis glycosyltransferase TuaC
MKILSILSATSNPLGMIFTHRQIDSLNRAGIENQYFFIPSEGLTIPRLIRLIHDLRTLIRNSKPDLVHSQYGMLYAFIAAYSNLRPLVITFHGSDLNKVTSDSFLKNAKKKILSNLAILRARQVICVSAAVAENIWWRKSIVNIVPLGINLDEFRPMDRREARSILGWKEDEIVILFNANNPVIKRLDLAEQSMHILKKSFPYARLEILYGKEDNRERIPTLLNASDCLLLCSDSEGSPTMVKEAMACNLPVVGVDVGDVRERLKGVEPSAVTAREPSALAHAISLILRSQKPSNGRGKLIADRLSEEAVAEKIREVYLKVLK